MRHSPLKLLSDVQMAAGAIQRFTAGMGESDYLASEAIRRAVEREFEIVGEALRRLSVQHPDLAGRITGAPQIIAFRNVLSHGYDAVEDSIVWSIVVKRLPTLLDEVNALMAEERSRP